jgi:hypothetical protein
MAVMGARKLRGAKRLLGRVHRKENQEQYRMVFRLPNLHLAAVITHRTMGAALLRRKATAGTILRVVGVEMEKIRMATQTVIKMGILPVIPLGILIPTQMMMKMVILPATPLGILIPIQMMMMEVMTNVTPRLARMTATSRHVIGRDLAIILLQHLGLKLATGNFNPKIF